MLHENGNKRATCTTLLTIEPKPFFLSTVHYYKHFADWEMLSVLLTYADLFSKHTFSKKNHKYHLSVTQFDSRSGPTFCRAWSGSKQFVRLSADGTS